MSGADKDLIPEFQERIKSSAAAAEPLRFVGGGTKDFYGRELQGAILGVSQHAGIVDYAPTELVITARSGTRLTEIKQVLSESGQMLAFEPPGFGDAATIGGTIACGFSGPRRPYAGAARDFVLGVNCINGRGDLLEFGGRVIKNVAGYDVSRLMTGSLGSLGLLTEISLKVLPLPDFETSLVLSRDAASSIEMMNQLAGRPLPISAASHDGERLFIRLSGAELGVRKAMAEIGGDVVESSAYWEELREQSLAFFKQNGVLWRLSVAPATPALSLSGDCLLDWGGGLRWLKTEQDAATIRTVVEDAGGHAIQFCGGDRSGEIFHPLAASVMALHRNLKQAFDPESIFNPGRMYAGI